MLKLPIIPGNVDHFIYIHGARILVKGEALRLLLIQTTKQRSQKETGKNDFAFFVVRGPDEERT